MAGKTFHSMKFEDVHTGFPPLSGRKTTEGVIASLIDGAEGLTSAKNKLDANLLSLTSKLILLLLLQRFIAVE